MPSLGNIKKIKEKKSLFFLSFIFLYNPNMAFIAETRVTFLNFFLIVLSFFLFSINYITLLFYFNIIIKQSRISIR